MHREKTRENLHGIRCPPKPPNPLWGFFQLWTQKPEQMLKKMIDSHLLSRFSFLATTSTYVFPVYPPYLVNS